MAVLSILVATAGAQAHGPLHGKIDILTRQIAESPGDWQLHLQRGELLRLDEDWEGASADFDAAARLDPSRAEVDLCRAAMLLDASRPAEALASADKFLARRPDHPDGLLIRARALTALRRHAEAVPALDRMIEVIRGVRPDHFTERAAAVLAAGGGLANRETALRALEGLDEGIARLGPVISLESEAIEIELALQREDRALTRLARACAGIETCDDCVLRRERIVQVARSWKEEVEDEEEESRQAALAAKAAGREPVLELDPAQGEFLPDGPREAPGEGSPLASAPPAPRPGARPKFAPPEPPSRLTSVSIPFPRGSGWRYDASGVDLGTSWRGVGYADGAWPFGPAPLGFGDPFIVTTVPYGPDPNDKYPTTYFRAAFTLTEDPLTYSSLSLVANYDDGFVAYVNGFEVLRVGLPASPTYTTYASSHEGGAYETFDLTSQRSAFVVGTNVIAVEVHQTSPTSTDLALDMEIAYAMTATVTRGPYLQKGTPTSVVVRWRTDAPTNSRVRYGDAPGSLGFSATDGTLTTEHEVQLTGLSPDTKYYYAVGTTGEDLAGDDANHWVMTPPTAGTDKPTRIWILGDSGQPGAPQNDVRDAYTAFTGSRPTDLFLMLGDNAYNAGTDAEYQVGLFNPYAAMLAKTVLWPTRGNHEVLFGGGNNDYYEFFTLPTAAEAGGVASGNEAYYSFDYGNIHFVCLDSEGTSRAPGGNMLTWLRNDLSARTADWTIAFWHHPPYTKGSHDSDNAGDSGGRMRDMRQNVLPILDSLGADVVLSGHSHCYERSFLLRGHYGTSGTLTPAMILDGGDGQEPGDGPYGKATLGPGPLQGVIYAVAGSSSKADGGALNHPAMFTSLNLHGSLVVDVDGNRLDARFLDRFGAVQDSFTVIKGPPVGVEPPAPPSLSVRLRSEGPNPFRAAIRFGYAIPEASPVSLTVVDASGRRVATLVDGARPAGEHTVVWDGRGDRGGRVGAGVYFAVLRAGGETRREKIVHID